MSDDGDLKLYSDDAQRRADHAFTALAHEAHVDGQCPRCKAIDDAVPMEASLLVLASSDLELEDLSFTPAPMNQKQAVAAEMLSAALSRYWSAFGSELTGARLNVLMGLLREQARVSRIHARIREARKDINARAQAAWQTGGEAAARAIEAEPTPDYPGKDRDEAWLAGGRYAQR